MSFPITSIVGIVGIIVLLVGVILAVVSKR